MRLHNTVGETNLAIGAFEVSWWRGVRWTFGIKSNRYWVWILNMGPIVLYWSRHPTKEGE